MTRTRPNSQRQAIFALADQGVPPTEIILRLGASRSAVYARLAERRQDIQTSDAWPVERVAALRRIHVAAMAVIAEAFETTPKAIELLLRRDNRNGAPSKPERLPPPAAADPAQILPQAIFEAPDTDPGPLPEASGPDAGQTVQSVETLSPGPRNPSFVKPATVRPAQAKGDRVYGLQSVDKKWLSRNGQGFTTVPSEAWSGTAEEAKQARLRFGNARFCKAREFDRG